MAASWSPDDIAYIGVEPGMSEGDVITVSVSTPVGVLRMIGLIEIEGRTLLVSGFHMQGASPGSVGIANLRLIGAAILERIDCDEGRVEGAVRTTGASPGHRPRVVRLTRRPGHPSG